MLDTDPQEDPDEEVNSSRDEVVTCSSQDGPATKIPPPTPHGSKKRKTSSFGLVNEAIINLKCAMNNNDYEFLTVWKPHSSTIKTAPSLKFLAAARKYTGINYDRENFMYGILFTYARSDSPRCHIFVRINV
jgi:hypothetical protein